MLSRSVVPLNPDAHRKVRTVEQPNISHRPMSLVDACERFYGKPSRHGCECMSCKAEAAAKAERRDLEDRLADGMAGEIETDWAYFKTLFRA